MATIPLYKGRLETTDGEALYPHTSTDVVFDSEGRTVETKFSEKQNKPTFTEITMLAAGWNAETKQYSFEATYPHANYDIEIQPSASITEEQLEVWCDIIAVGSATSNVLTAKGEVPTIDIPIIVKAVAK